MANMAENTRKSWFTYFRYDEGRESPADARNVLLIVTGLIAAVTFQAGVNPPGGVWQDDGKGHRAGRAIYARDEVAFYVFLVSNTVAFSACILILLSLTYTFPFRFEIMIATASMVATYAASIFAVTPSELDDFRFVLLAAFGPFIIRGLLYMWTKFKIKTQPI